MDPETGLTLGEVLEQAEEQEIDFLSLEEGETVSFIATYGNKIHVFTTEIPRNVKVQESQANAEPAILYDPKSNSAKAYIEFAKEVSGYGREEQIFERDEDAQRTDAARKAAPL